MDGIAWAASAMVAARTRLEIATQNLANVSTSAFTRVVARGTLTSRGAVVRPVAGAERGALRYTGRDGDLAIVGPGAFSVRGTDGATTATRAGGFTRDRDGTLRDDRGRALLGTRGLVRVPEGGRIDERGWVLAADGTATGRIALPAGSSLRAGYVENASVDAVTEMIDVLAAERAFESAQKVVSAIDQVRQKSSSDVARVK